MPTEQSDHASSLVGVNVVDAGQERSRRTCTPPAAESRHERRGGLGMQVFPVPTEALRPLLGLQHAKGPRGSPSARTCTLNRTPAIDGPWPPTGQH